METNIVEVDGVAVVVGGTGINGCSSMDLVRTGRITTSWKDRPLKTRPFLLPLVEVLIVSKPGCAAQSKLFGI